jgi:hypothetical protein
LADVFQAISQDMPSADLQAELSHESFVTSQAIYRRNAPIRA